jgi:hypothetical protein
VTSLASRTVCRLHYRGCRDVAGTAVHVPECIEPAEYDDDGSWAADFQVCRYWGVPRRWWKGTLVHMTGVLMKAQVESQSV